MEDSSLRYCALRSMNSILGLELLLAYERFCRCGDLLAERMRCGPLAAEDREQTSVGFDRVFPGCARLIRIRANQGTHSGERAGDLVGAYLRADVAIVNAEQICLLFGRAFNGLAETLAHLGCAQKSLSLIGKNKAEALLFRRFDQQSVSCRAIQQQVTAAHKVEMVVRRNTTGDEQRFRPRAGCVDDHLIAEATSISCDFAGRADSFNLRESADAHSGAARHLGSPEAESAIIHLRVEEGEAAEQIVRVKFRQKPLHPL